MKSLHKELELAVKTDEEKLKYEKGISGFEIYKLKKANYKIISEKTYNNLIKYLKKYNTKF